MWGKFEIDAAQVQCAVAFPHAARLNFRMLAAVERYSPAKILCMDVKAAKFDGLTEVDFRKSMDS